LNSDKVTQIYRAAVGLKDAMLMVQQGTTEDHAKYSAYKTFAEKYNELARAATAEVSDLKSLSLFVEERLGNYMNTLWPFQKSVFDSAYANLLILISGLEGKLDLRRNDVANIRNFIMANLRKAIFEPPADERGVQNALESIFVGKGLQKGIDYDRETGRVKTSTKEVVPDFILYKQNLSCEVKLIKDKTRVGSCIDEINSDITAYSSKYSYMLFVVYDMGAIRDEVEFTSGFAKNENVSCILVKH
jgi:hypothetical protein